MESALTDTGLLLTCSPSTSLNQLRVVKGIPPLAKAVNYGTVFHILTSYGTFEILNYAGEQVNIIERYPPDDKMARVLDFSSQDRERYALLLEDGHSLINCGQYRQIVQVRQITGSFPIRIQFRASPLCTSERGSSKPWLAILLTTESRNHYLTLWNYQRGWVCVKANVLNHQLYQVKLSLADDHVYLICLVNGSLMIILANGVMWKLIDGNVLKAHLSDDMRLTTLQGDGRLTIWEKNLIDVSHTRERAEQFTEVSTIHGVANFKAVSNGLLFWKIPNLVFLLNYQQEIILSLSSHSIIFEDYALPC